MKYIYLLLLLTFSISTLLSASPLESTESDSILIKAWDAFANNDRTQATALFKAVIKQNPGSGSAYFGLSLIHEYELDINKSWRYLTEASKYQENSDAFLYATIRFGILPVIDNPESKASDFLYDVLSETKRDPIIKAIAYEMLGTYYEHRGDVSKSKKLYSMLNPLNDWSVIGPFENISASGYDAIYPPETEYDTSKTYVGKTGTPAHWFHVTKTRNDLWFDFQRYFGYYNAVYYANTFVYSPKKQSVQLRVGTSGSAKVFLNDDEVIGAFEESNNDVDTYVAQTELQEGWNRILVKCGYSEISRCNFMVRITDLNGSHIGDLTVSTDPQTYQKHPHPPVTFIENFAEAFYKAKIKQNPEMLENYILLAKSYLFNEKTVEAELALRDAFAIAPNCAPLYSYLMETYTRAFKKSEVFSCIEKLTALDPVSPATLVLKIGKALGNEKFDEAADLINQLGPILPDSENLYSMLIQYYNKKNQEDKSNEIAQRAFDRYPYRWEFASQSAGTNFGSTDGRERALTIYNRHLRFNYSTTALSEIASIYLANSDISNWEKTYDKIFELDPAGTGFYAKKAEGYVAQNNRLQAVATLTKACALSPGHSEYYSMLGRIFRFLRIDDKAKEMFETALKYTPTLYQTRLALRELQGKRSIYANFVENNIDSLVKNTPLSSQYPNDDAIILLNDTRRIVYGRGATEKMQEVLMKVFNNKGIDDLKEYVIQFNQYNENLIIEEAHAIKTNGTKVKADINANQLVFKSLEANDCIYLRWRITNYYSGSLSQHFWDDVAMNAFYPTKRVSYSLLIPDSVKFKYVASNFHGVPTERRTSDGTLYEWRLEDDPGIEPERSMPPVNDIVKQLHITTIEQWSDIVDWYASLTKTKTRLTFEIKEQLQKLFPGNETLTEDEKIKRIYDFITENIRYSSVPFRQSALIPQKARTVLVDRIGDCKDVATLGIAMLREVGVQADYVLVLTRDQGKNNDVLPSIAFNHCIVRAQTTSGERYIDFTAYNYPYLSLPFPDRNAFCLDIKPGVTKPGEVWFPHVLSNNVFRTISSEITGDGMLTVQDTSTRTGEAYASFRSWFRDKGQKDKEKELAETMAKDYPTMKLRSFDTGNLDTAKTYLTYSFSFDVPNYITEAGTFKLFKLPWDDKMEPEEALSNDSRKYPYFWVYPDTLINTIQLKIPKGYKPDNLPKTVSYSSSVSDYTVTYNYAKGIVSAKRTMISKGMLIMPEKFSEFKDYCNKVIKEDNRQIFLKR